MFAIKVPTNAQSAEMNRADSREVRSRSILPSPPPKPTSSKSFIIVLFLFHVSLSESAK